LIQRSSLEKRYETKQKQCGKFHGGKMKKIKLILLLTTLVTLVAACNNPGTVPTQDDEIVERADHTITIKEQGSFSVGGTVVQMEGAYESQNFDSWQPYQEGQTYHGDHASVFYQVPENSHDLSMVFLHGAGQSARSWQTTPDGRDGFQNIFLKRGFSTYLIDQPRRGQAGRSTVETQITPVADEQMWFEIWRMGDWPNYAEGVQFPQDEESLGQFFRWMTPNTGDFDAALISNATAAVFEESGDGILVTHSQGGLPGWMAAVETDKIAAIASYEPGNYLFPEDEVPEALPSRTGELQGIGVSMDEFMKLTEIPIVIYFGDYIPAADELSDELGAENWRVRLELGRQFVEMVNKYGGDATMVVLPEVGIYGNTHFLFAELNNVELADHLSDWMAEKQLD